MESVLNTRFKRVEVALASLIDSIAKYNTNPTHATDLVAADAELGKGLELLTTHQLNYARVLSLRKISKVLDSQIRDTLEHLVLVRKEIISTPATDPITNVSSISYTELLDYARRISKFTSPPSYYDPVINSEAVDATNSRASDVISSPNIDNSKPQTQSKNINGKKHSTGDFKNEAIQGSVETKLTSQSTIIANNNNWSDYLNPRSDKPWTPWPSEETIRRGALASIQVLINQGIDPATFDPEKSAELEAERKRVVDEEDQVREEQRQQLEAERNLRYERHAAANAPESISDRRKPPLSQPKVFQLETFDDDDEEED